MILLAHPTANQNVRQTALALAEAGLLEEFWTCVNWKRGGLFDRSLRFSEQVRNELRRRSFPPKLQPFIHTHPWREWLRQLAGQLGLLTLFSDARAPLSIHSVYQSLDRRVATRLTDLPITVAIYAYEDGALKSFQEARQHGRKCIYEHPVTYWRKVRELQREEAALDPQWASTLTALRDTDEIAARKDEELRLADTVIVASNFSRESLRESPTLTASVEVIGYGAPPVANAADEQSVHRGKLRVLFVGALSQAKGLGYLLEAIKRLEQHVDLTLIGHRLSPTIPAPAVLARHRWIPSLPHDEILAEMRRHDVLVFPSLHEGFGLVILEALAQGIPVITTAHTGGPDVLEEGIDGFIVPIRSVDAIAEKLELLLRDSGRLPEMKRAALRKAARYQWDIYRERVAAVAREVIAR